MFKLMLLTRGREHLTACLFLNNLAPLVREFLFYSEGRSVFMAIFKRGKIYWYHFLFNGQHIQESTKQGNPRVARQIEAAHRTALAKGEVGIRERKPVPTLKEFIENRFEPWAKAQFETAS